MKPLLNYLVAIISAVNPIFATITLASGTVLAVFTWLNTLWTDLLARIDALSAASFAGTLSFAPMGLTNTFLPLTEALSFFSAWLLVLSACTVIRVVKGFIPTIAT